MFNQKENKIMDKNMKNRLLKNKKYIPIKELK